MNNKQETLEELFDYFHVRKFKEVQLLFDNQFATYSGDILKDLSDLKREFEAKGWTP